MAGRVFQEHGRPAAFDVGGQPPQRRNQLRRAAGHVLLVVNDEAGDAPIEAPDERRDPLAVTGGQHIEAAVQVHGRQHVRFGSEREHTLERGAVVRVQLRGQPGLLEPQPREPQQRVVASDTLLEQCSDLAHLPSRAGRR